MQRFNLLTAGPYKRRQDDAQDWKQTAPRWFLLLLIAAGLVFLGFLVASLETNKAREQQRLEAAILDAPTKYQARLSERVAVVEAQTQQLSKAVGDLTAEVKQQNQASMALTIELKALNAVLAKTGVR